MKASSGDGPRRTRGCCDSVGVDRTPPALGRYSSSLLFDAAAEAVIDIEGRMRK
jgi:hypothetical protein